MRDLESSSVGGKVDALRKQDIQPAKVTFWLYSVNETKTFIAAAFIFYWVVTTNSANVIVMHISRHFVLIVTRIIRMVFELSPRCDIPKIRINIIRVVPQIRKTNNGTYVYADSTLHSRNNWPLASITNDRSAERFQSSHSDPILYITYYSKY